jgi:hypothetical protein
MALAAWRLCRRAYGTQAFPLALFVGIPMIYEPFNFVFVFGGFDGSVSQTLFWAGLLNLTSNYLDKIAPVKAATSTPVGPSARVAPSMAAPPPRRGVVVARR